MRASAVKAGGLGHDRLTIRGLRLRNKSFAHCKEKRNAGQWADDVDRSRPGERACRPASAATGPPPSSPSAASCACATSPSPSASPTSRPEPTSTCSSARASSAGCTAAPCRRRIRCDGHRTPARAGAAASRRPSPPPPARRRASARPPPRSCAAARASSSTSARRPRRSPARCALAATSTTSTIFTNGLSIALELESAIPRFTVVAHGRHAAPAAALARRPARPGHPRRAARRHRLHRLQRRRRRARRHQRQPARGRRQDRHDPRAAARAVVVADSSKLGEVHLGAHLPSRRGRHPGDGCRGSRRAHRRVRAGGSHRAARRL